MGVKVLSNKKIDHTELVSVVIVLVFCELFFFRNIIGNGALIGDNGDGRLTALLTEHWWNFLNGEEGFYELDMFYPSDEVIGYTDLLLAYGIIHSFFRLTGLDIYIAYKFTLIVVHFFGTVSMYYLLRYKLKCQATWALFGTIAFSFSNAYSVHICHTQLDAVSFLPLLLILGIGFICNIGSRCIRNIYAYSFIAWFVLLTYNSWYVACFTGIFSLFLIIIYLVSLCRSGIHVITLLKTVFKKIGWDLLGYMAAAVILYIPFLRIYLPVIGESYTYKGVVPYMPELVDLFNVTEDNLIMGWLVKALNLQERGYSDEVAQGFSIVLISMFVYLFISTNKKKYSYRNEQNSTGSILGECFVKSIFVSILVSILIIVKISSNGVSAWWLVYTFIPVVRSMRAVARFWMWLCFPIAVITSYTANEYFAGSEMNKRIRLPSVIIIALLFVSNINIAGVSSLWNIDEEKGFLSEVKSPPKETENFYIFNVPNNKLASVYYQTDAFDIATQYKIKTINGYSGQIPRGWDGIIELDSDIYESSVYKWIVDNEMDNVYAYNMKEDKWVQFEDRVDSFINDSFYPKQQKLSASSGYDYHPGDESVWTERSFYTTIRNEKIRGRGLLIQMGMELNNYLAQNLKETPYVHIFVNGELVKNISVENGMRLIKVPVTQENDIYNIEIKTNCYFNPKELGINDDERNLSLNLYYIGPAANIEDLHKIY